MITELIMNAFYLVVSVLATPLQLVMQPFGSFAGLIELFSYASIFVPLSVVGQCLGGWLLLQSARFVFVIVNWIIGKIPTID
jgi:hypothetical protein